MNATYFNAPLRRFVWKEYRMLRGFWIGVFCLGILADLFFGFLAITNIELSLLRMTVAFAAATLYAAGTSAILFSVEHDEQTYGFLRNLPANSGPALVGKILVATLTSLALAAALSLVVWISSGRWESDQDSRAVLGVFGPAIFEAVAWGTLFSLLLKRPLVAAIATLVVGALSAELAVTVTAASDVAVTQAASYASAIPLRLAIVIAVFALDIFLGRKWLTPRVNRVADYSSSQIVAHLKLQRTASASIATPFPRSRPRGMLTPLIWQTWRDSRWRLLLPLAFVAGYVLLVLATHSLWPRGDTITGVSGVILCITPALYGSLAFSTDHRRGQKRFLAEHAAAPRWVWLSRHLVWVGSFTALLLIASLAVIDLGLFGWQSRVHSMLFEQRFIDNLGTTYSILSKIAKAIGVLHSTMLLICYGSLTAYSIGQLCSMLLSSEILSAFLAILLAVVLSGWIAAVYLWQLSGALFLLPLAAGALLATWLRAPDWIAGRNAWRHWLRPAAALFTPLILLAILPTVRLDQLHGARWPTRLLTISQSSGTQSAPSESDLSALKQQQSQDRTEAEKTAELYRKASLLFDAPIEDSPVATWARKYPGRFAGTIDEDHIPHDELEAFYAAKRKLTELVLAQREQALKQVVEASERPTCQFDFRLSPEAIVDANRTGRLSENRPRGMSLHDGMTALQNTLLFLDFERTTYAPHVPFERLYAALRMSVHMLSGQPTVVVREQFEQQKQAFGRIRQWAQESDRTPEELHDALDKLETFRVWPNPYDTYMAEQNSIRKVLDESEPPAALSRKPIPIGLQLALSANQLSWERTRALLANAQVCNYEGQLAATTVHDINASTPQPLNTKHLLLQRPDNSPVTWQDEFPGAATSYLFAMEYNARVSTQALIRAYCDAETCRRATVINIALILRRLDQHAYPNSLSYLAPTYLKSVPLDPYSMQPFVYMPDGLSLPLVEYSDTNKLNIAPKTPLFWSVGSTDVTLEACDFEQASSANSGRATNPYDHTFPSYVLKSADTPVVFPTTPLVFTLPE